MLYEIFISHLYIMIHLRMASGDIVNEIITLRSRIVRIMKLAICSSCSTITPTPLYTSSLFLPAGQYWTHITWTWQKEIIKPKYYRKTTYIYIYIYMYIYIYEFLLTRMKSKVLVTITIQEHLSCQTILQKSPIVFSVGPWVTI